MTILAGNRPLAEPVSVTTTPVGSAAPGRPRRPDVSSDPATGDALAAQARRLHRSGWTVHRIAVELRTNEKAVRERLAESGVNVKQSPRRHSEADSNDALSLRAGELYWNGASVARVAWELGVSRRTVWRLLAAAGTLVAPDRIDQTGVPSLTTAGRAAALYRTGLPAAGVAHMMGITERSARRLLAEAGVTMRAPANVRHTLPVDPEVGSQAAELYRSGLAVHAVAVRLGVSDNLARRLLVEQGVVIRKPRGRQPAAPPADPTTASQPELGPN